jgi:hypothetical protein
LCIIIKTIILPSTSSICIIPCIVPYRPSAAAAAAAALAQPRQCTGALTQMTTSALT